MKDLSELCFYLFTCTHGHFLGKICLFSLVGSGGLADISVGACDKISSMWVCDLCSQNGEIVLNINSLLSFQEDDETLVASPFSQKNFSRPACPANRRLPSRWAIRLPTSSSSNTSSPSTTPVAPPAYPLQKNPSSFTYTHAFHIDTVIIRPPCHWNLLCFSFLRCILNTDLYCYGLKKCFSFQLTHSFCHLVEPNWQNKASSVSSLLEWRWSLMPSIFINILYSGLDSSFEYFNLASIPTISCFIDCIFTFNRTLSDDNTHLLH